MTRAGGAVAFRGRRWTLHPVTRLAIGWIVGFSLVVTVSALNKMSGNAGDMGLYAKWSAATTHGLWVGLDTLWVYPAGAVIPMLAAAQVGSGAQGGFITGWVVVVALTHGSTVAWLALTRGRLGIRAGWVLTLLLVALGSVSVFRIDIIVACLVTVAGVVLGQHPRIAGWLLAVGVWTKAWPAAVVVAVATTYPRWWRIVLPTVFVSAAVFTISIARGNSPVTAFGFFSVQSGRGLQVESVFALPALWLRAMGAPVVVEYNIGLSTYEVHGPGVNLLVSVAHVCGALLATLIVASLIRCRTQLLGPRSISLIFFLVPLTALTTSTALSPQYVTWLYPGAVMMCLSEAKRWRSKVLLVGVVAILTQIMFPFAYGAFLDGSIALLTVATARMFILLGLLLWCFREVWHIGSRESFLSEKVRP